MTYLYQPTPTVAVIEPPPALLTAAEVRARLKVTEDDAVLSPLIKAVCAQIEPPNGWVGKAFGLQTLEMRSELFGYYYCGCAGHRLKLRYPPFRGMVSVKYLDAGGVEQTVDPATYEVVGASGTGTPYLALAYGATWPTTRSSAEAVRVRYTAGYDHDDPQLDAAKSAVALAVRNLLTLASRDPSISSVNLNGVGSRNYVYSQVSASVLTGAVDALLQGYRDFTQ